MQKKMEERNTIDSTTELTGEELIHTIVTEVEQLRSEQFGNTTATFDSLLPNYSRCNSVSLHMKQVSSVRTGKVDGKRFTFELHSIGASPKSPQSSRAGSKTHSCAECKKQFNFKSHLTRHVRIHSGIRRKCEKTFQCEICNAAFTQSESLRSHQRIHSGEKPFQCEICNASFSRAHNLKKHQLIHSDDRPFMCDICKKSFRLKFVLSRHMDIHSGRKAHKCNVCEKEFRQKSNLTKHFEIHLKGEPSQL